jgi:hypothetical protein
MKNTNYYFGILILNLITHAGTSFADPNPCAGLTNSQIAARCTLMATADLAPVRAERITRCGPPEHPKEHTAQETKYDLGVKDGKLTLLKRIAFIPGFKLTEQKRALMQARLESIFEEIKSFFLKEGIVLEVEYSILNVSDVDARPNFWGNYPKAVINKKFNSTNTTIIHLRFERSEDAISIGDNWNIGPLDQPYHFYGNPEFSKVLYIHEFSHEVGFSDEYKERAFSDACKINDSRPDSLNCSDSRAENCYNVMRGRRWKSETTLTAEYAHDSFYSLIQPICPRACDFGEMFLY